MLRLCCAVLWFKRPDPATCFSGDDHEEGESEEWIVGLGQGHNRRTLEQILQIVIAILGEPANLDLPLFKSDTHVSAQPIDELEGSCSLSSR